MKEEILTIQEVAELLKVADKTVYTMAKKWELPAFKVGGNGGYADRTSTDGSPSVSHEAVGHRRLRQRQTARKGKSVGAEHDL